MAQIARTQNRKLSQTLKNLALDLTLFVAFIVDVNLQLTGIPIHEWLGILFGGLFMLHVIFHWEWVVSITRRFFGRAPVKDKINYVLNLALYIDFVLITVSGILISRSAMATLGITVNGSRYWTMLHHTTADLSIFLIGLHLALHWKWITNALGRYIWRPLAGRRQQPIPLKELKESSAL